MKYNLVDSTHPALKTRTKQIVSPSRELKLLVADLKYLVYKHEALGIAANQVGSLVSVCLVLNKIMINPRIEVIDQTLIPSNEGCLSFPGHLVDAMRFKKIKVNYLNEHFKVVNEEMQGIYSIVAQHEIDHLNGVVFFERKKV